MRILARLETASYMKGDKVQVLSTHWNRWYAATIVGPGKKPGTWVIDWVEPGNPNETVPENHIKVKGARPVKPPVSSGVEEIYTQGYADGDNGNNPYETYSKEWLTYNLGKHFRQRGWRRLDGKQITVKKDTVSMDGVDFEFDRRLFLTRGSITFLGLPSKKDPNLNTSWESPDYGKRTIVGSSWKIRDQGGLYYDVRSEKMKGVTEQIPAYMLDRIKNVDAMNIKSRAAAAEIDKKRADTEVQALSMNGFADTLTPMERGKAQKALVGGKGIVVNKKAFRSIAEAIEDLVIRGYTVEDFGNRKVLMSPNGAYLEGKAFTALGLRYAEYLYKKPFAEWAKRPADL